jgi:pSer/pThr/pTyr-binding forkhead associated (FHA) protein
MSDETIRVPRPTLVDIPMAEFGRPEPRLRLVGVLTPVVGVITEPFTITGAEFILGRERSAAACIPDESVSRQHAKITRREDVFTLIDMGSINGTFVDGVPVVSCTLRDGDAIQIGHNLFYFDRLLELIPAGAHPGGSYTVAITPLVTRKPGANP